MRGSEIFVERTKQTGLYNIQAIDNIPSIMRRGLLSNERAQRVTHTSIAMNEVQERRDNVKIPNGLKLHQYANVYFDPHNSMLSARRSQNENICILKIDYQILDIPGVIISDRNASSDYASFYSPEMGMNLIDFDLVYARYWIDEDYFEQMRKKSIKCAEVLVPHVIPYDYVICAAVINEVAAEKLQNVGFDKQIQMEPRIFF